MGTTGEEGGRVGNAHSLYLVRICINLRLTPVSSPPIPPPPIEEPLAPIILSQCEELKDLVAEFVRRTGEEKGEGEEDPRGNIPLQTKELLVNWLSNKNMVSRICFLKLPELF